MTEANRSCTIDQTPITHKLNKQIFTDTISIQLSYYPLHCNPPSYQVASPIFLLSNEKAVVYGTASHDPILG